MTRRIPWSILWALVALGCPAEPRPPQGAHSPRGTHDRTASSSAGAWQAPSPPLPRYAPRESSAAGVAPRGGSVAPPPRPAPLLPPDGVEARGARPARGVALAAGDRAFAARITRHHRGGRAVRMLVETDRPLYRPGDTIWVRAAEVHVQRNRPVAGKLAHVYELIDPRGSVVQSVHAYGKGGHTHSQLDLRDGLPGGEYRVRVRNRRAERSVERRVIVAVYQAPRIQKRLTFLRRAYGPGDRAEALLSLRRATGQPLRHHALRVVARLGDREVKRWTLRTDAEGNALVALDLPAALVADEGLLNVLVDDGGVTESIARPIPLALRRLELGFFPEGGAAVWDLPSRVYFAARRARDGKPADLEGEVRDAAGQVVARLRSFHDGMGRFVYTPRKVAGRPQAYTLHVTRPAGTRQTFRLPAPADRGVTLQLVDDYDSQRSALELVVHARRAERVTLIALQHETLVAQRALGLLPGPQRVTLPLAAAWRGILRVTVFDARHRPLAERLVFRHRGQGLRILATPDRATYQPRDTVTLRLRALTPAGRPVPGARLGVAVVDDTALTFADDEEPHWLAQRYLTGQLTGRLHRPRFYFDPKEPKALRALDLVMGTHGWRGFAWADLAGPRRIRQAPGVRRPKVPAPSPRGQRRLPPKGRGVAAPPAPGPAPRPAPPPVPDPPDPSVPRRFAVVLAKNRIVIIEKIYFTPRSPRVRRVSFPILDAVAASLKEHPKLRVCVEGHADPREERRALAQETLAERRAAGVLGYLVRKGVPRARLGLYGWGAMRPMAPSTSEFNRARNRRVEFRIVREGEDIRGCEVSFAREFPTEFYRSRQPPDGVRRDFRDTVFWDPAVTTDQRGEATVRFGLADSVTSYRVRVSGLGQGLLGLAERVIPAVRPFHLAVKAPHGVSAGDGMVLPLTLRNEGAQPLRLRVTATLPSALRLIHDPAPGVVSLGPGRARTYYYPIRVVAQRGRAPLVFRATADGLVDAFEHTVDIRPRGLPRERSWSGVLSGAKQRVFDLTLPRDLREASPDIRLQLYPNPLATLVSGMEGMLREPVGCFEQASSANYPNVMILRMLRAGGAPSPALRKRATDLLARGYQKLVGYETKTRGYEWFGAAPGHEALSAYGLLQFMDMAAVYPAVDAAMVQRTARWVLDRRDGTGRYRRNTRALDAFGGASPEITAAYVTWSLAEAGQRGLAKELGYLKTLAGQTGDPYVIALAVNALVKVEGRGSAAARALAGRLLRQQQPTGGFRGLTHSITRSTGPNLDVETTALAVLALIRAGGAPGPVERAVRWLRQQRSQWGTFGATQSTVLALRALVAYQETFPRVAVPGEVVVLVNGQEADRARYGARVAGTVTLTRFARALRPGPNRIALRFTSAKSVPFSLGVRYTTRDPASSPDVAVAVATRLTRSTLALGETTRLVATLRNRTAKAQPMVLLRLGYPGAFRPETWQLKALRDQGRIAAYETRPREVILYLRGLAPRARLELPVELVARVPGHYVAPASSAYLYYSDDQKAWASPLVATVTP